MMIGTVLMNVKLGKPMAILNADRTRLTEA